MITIKNKRKRLLMLTFFVLLIVGVVAITTAAGELNDQTTYETNRLILELDMEELPEFIGKTFEVNFTAVTKAETVTVSMYFDGMSSNPVWEETSDFFVNERVTINVENAELAPGMGHEFTIYAEDSLGESDSISKIITVDTINPEFNFLSLEHIAESGHTTLITEDKVELHENEYLRINWTVYDENFLEVLFIVDETKSDNFIYPASASKNIHYDYFSIDLIDVTEQTFKLEIIAYDKAENIDSYSWSVVKFEAEDDSVPKDEYDKLLEEQEEERKATARLAGFCAIFSTLTGAIIAVIVTVSFIKTSGFQKVIDSDRSVGHDDDYFNRNREYDEKGLGETKTNKTIEKLKKEKQQYELEKEEIRKEQTTKTKKEKIRSILWITVSFLISSGILIGLFSWLFLSNIVLTIILFIIGGLAIITGIILAIILLIEKWRKK